MGKYSRKVSPQRKILAAVSAVLVVILVLLIVWLIWLKPDKAPAVSVPDSTEGTVAAQTEETLSQMKELLVEKVTEQEDAVLVSTTYVAVKYPYAFSDIVSVETETFEDYAVLEFGAIIGDATHKAYSLIFNGEEGMPVGTLQHDGETYVITVQFHDADGVGEENMATFYAAQETFNDVVNSLSENKGFTAAN